MVVACKSEDTNEVVDPKYDSGTMVNLDVSDEVEDYRAHHFMKYQRKRQPKSLDGFRPQYHHCSMTKHCSVTMCLEWWHLHTINRQYNSGLHGFESAYDRIGDDGQKLYPHMGTYAPCPTLEDEESHAG